MKSIYHSVPYNIETYIITYKTFSARMPESKLDLLVQKTAKRQKKEEKETNGKKRKVVEETPIVEVEEEGFLSDNDSDIEASDASHGTKSLIQFILIV